MNYASIRELDISNGESVGVALFVQGCPFNPHCHNCFNPETWDFNGGKEWTKDVEKEFLNLIKRPYIKRISFLGGEPLAEQNLDDILNLVNEIRPSFPNKNIWLYSGYTWESIFGDYGLDISNNSKRREIIRKCNIMVDGKYIDSKRDVSLKWRGSSNQRVIDIQKTLQRGEIVLHCN